MSRNEDKRESGGGTMRQLLSVAAVALALVSNPTLAQAPSPAWSSPGYVAAYLAYRYVSPTPWDAYKQGLINRWELEQLEGSLPQALQGPSPHARGGSGGGGN